VVRKDRSYADVFGIDDRQRPGGFFSEHSLYEKGIEQCDSSKYLAPWRDTNDQVDKAVLSEFGNIPGDHPREIAPTCGSIDAASVGRDDELQCANNRCIIRP
jgi:hypothetical protein